MNLLVGLVGVVTVVVGVVVAMSKIIIGLSFISFNHCKRGQKRPQCPSLGFY